MCVWETLRGPGAPCPACFGCLPAPTHLIQKNVEHAGQGLKNTVVP